MGDGWSPSSRRMPRYRGPTRPTRCGRNGTANDQSVQRDQTGVEGVWVDSLSTYRQSTHSKINARSHSHPRIHQVGLRNGRQQAKLK